MRETRVSLPQLALIAATRGMMGVGLGFLLSGWIGRQRRIAVGSALFGIGALSTIPLVLGVFGRDRRSAARGAQAAEMPGDLPVGLEDLGLEDLGLEETATVIVVEE
jgi:hypothetical protein